MLKFISGVFLSWLTYVSFVWTAGWWVAYGLLEHFTNFGWTHYLLIPAIVGTVVLVLAIISLIAVLMHRKKTN